MANIVVASLISRNSPQDQMFSDVIPLQLDANVVVIKREYISTGRRSGTQAAHQFGCSRNVFYEDGSTASRLVGAVQLLASWDFINALQ